MAPIEEGLNRVDGVQKSTRVLDGFLQSGLDTALFFLDLLGLEAGVVAVRHGMLGRLG